MCSFGMGAPAVKTMKQTKTSGLKKFFKRKNKEPAPLSAPVKLTNTDDAKKANNTAEFLHTKKSRRGFWSKKEGRAPEPVSSSSGSSEDIAVIPSKFDADYNETRETRIESIQPIVERPASNNIQAVVAENQQPQRRSPEQEHPFQGQEIKFQQEELSVIQQKQLVKERDGFCRRVDKYDGSVVTVEGKAAYELGNYLGGGVAGVVYEGHRLLPETEYPVRLGKSDETPSVIEVSGANDLTDRVNSLLSFVPPNCLADNTENTEVPKEASVNPQQANMMFRDDGSLLTMDSFRCNANNTSHNAAHTDTVALEAVDDAVIVDNIDGPSRSKHMAKAAQETNKNNEFPTDASFTDGFMEETVAIKILNPVGFRTLSADVTNSAVVARQGAPLSEDCVSGKSPMEEKHVWWLINPSSRNLRTLQRYSVDTQAPRGVEVDRGSPEKGLRISLIAAYKDPRTKKLKELPLTRCIEIWGHVPFEASDAEFREVMGAIDKINQGLPPPPMVPGRVGTATSSMMTGYNSLNMDELKTTSPLTAKRT